MRTIWFGIITIVALSGCSGWGDYQHKSDRFKFRASFPSGWEVWDRSDDRRDFLVAINPKIEHAEIQLIAEPVAPDLSPREIYLKLTSTDLEIIDKGMISCKDAEGRYIIITDKVDEVTMKGMRTLFLGNRFTLEVGVMMRAEDFDEFEPVFRRMIREIEL